MRLSSVRSDGTSTILLLHSYVNPSKFKLTWPQNFFSPLEGVVVFFIFFFFFLIFWLVFFMDLCALKLKSTRI